MDKNMNSRLKQGLVLLRQYFQTHSTIYTFATLFHLGFSDISTSIIAASTQYKAYKKLKRKYKRFIQSTVENLNSGIKDVNKYPYKNVFWFFWYQGFEQAPELVHICYESIKRNFPERQIILLDKDNIKEYIDLPVYIWEKFHSGHISFAHFSDLIRLSLLIRYGGTWIDSTVYCTGRNNSDDLINADLFVFRSLAPGNNCQISYISNWMISAKPSFKILTLTYELLIEYWRTYNQIVDYYLFHIFMTIAIENFPDEWEKCPIRDNGYPHLLQFSFDEPFNLEKFNEIKALSDFHKLSNKFSKENSKIESFGGLFFAKTLI